MVRSRQNVAEALERISALNATLNAFIAIFEADAMAEAQVLDEELRQGRSRGPLHGRPISIKDLIDVKGWPTTAASRVRAGHVARDDASVVARLRDAGAVIIGKCNLHEIALGTTSDESAFGPVLNPRDVSRSPGGSSGGSAAAVAAGHGMGVDRHRYRRVDSNPGRSLRRCRVEADVWRDTDDRRGAAVDFPRSRRADRANGTGRVGILRGSHRHGDATERQLSPCGTCASASSAAIFWKSWMSMCGCASKTRWIG